RSPACSKFAQSNNLIRVCVGDTCCRMSASGSPVPFRSREFGGLQSFISARQLVNGCLVLLDQLVHFRFELPPGFGRFFCIGRSILVEFDLASFRLFQGCGRWRRANRHRSRHSPAAAELDKFSATTAGAPSRTELTGPALAMSSCSTLCKSRASLERLFKQYSLPSPALAMSSCSTLCKSRASLERLFKQYSLPNPSSAIMCYQCDSQEDSSCPDSRYFDQRTNALIDCTSFQARVPGTFCVKIYQESTAVLFRCPRSWRTNRLVFAAGIFEDIRLTKEQWAEQKKNSPTGVMPFVDTGDKSKGLLAQSGAIARYYAKKAGLMGSNDWEYYLVERAMCQLDDIFMELVKFMMAPEDKKPDLLKEFQAEKGPKLLSGLVDFLKQAGGQYFAGKSLSLADLGCLNILDSLANMPDLLAKYPELTELKKRVLAGNAKLAEYIKNRPVTPM
uniref:Glutathione transferase n=1 Tax=Macrostomum lignano TaxID=282301 RepID=A0A1I8IPG4_9PLAT